MGRVRVFTLFGLLRRYWLGAGALLSLLLMGSLTWSAGGVALPGDINGDGVVNILDSVLLRRSLVGQDQNIEEACGAFGFTPFSLPATGQMSCWDPNGSMISCTGTGQDGDVRAGAALSYVDNMDGTITDLNTGLMWEKKNDDGGVHDKDNTFRQHEVLRLIDMLNNPNAPFAGHTDWRVPNSKELYSLVDLAKSMPSIDSAFDTDCMQGCSMTGCSCTASSDYWSSTSDAFFPRFGWVVGFFDGFVDVTMKGDEFPARAVRGPTSLAPDGCGVFLCSDCVGCQ